MGELTNAEAQGIFFYFRKDGFASAQTQQGTQEGIKPISFVGSLNYIICPKFWREKLKSKLTKTQTFFFLENHYIM